jgi:hypothetical protein
MNFVQALCIILAVGAAHGALPHRKHHISIEDPSSTSGKKEFRLTLMLIDRVPIVGVAENDYLIL